jgi:hypothetical protein
MRSAGRLGQRERRGERTLACSVEALRVEIHGERGRPVEVRRPSGYDEVIVSATLRARPFMIVNVSTRRARPFHCARSA